MFLMTYKKIILLICFSFLILSCDCENKLTGGGGSEPLKLSVADPRCTKIEKEFKKKAVDNGFCDPKPEYEKISCQGNNVVFSWGDTIYCSSKPGLTKVKNSEVDLRIPIGDYYKTLDKCRDFWNEQIRLCAELPPFDRAEWDKLFGDLEEKYSPGEPVTGASEPVCN